ncbi:uncharacterized protein LOC144453078 [Glandiceps talaboti]
MNQEQREILYGNSKFISEKIKFDKFVAETHKHYPRILNEGDTKALDIRQKEAKTFYLIRTFERIPDGFYKFYAVLKQSGHTGSILEVLEPGLQKTQIPEPNKRERTSAKERNRIPATSSTKRQPAVNHDTSDLLAAIATSITTALDNCEGMKNLTKSQRELSNKIDSLSLGQTMMSDKIDSLSEGMNSKMADMKQDIEKTIAMLKTSVNKLEKEFSEDRKSREELLKTIKEVKTQTQELEDKYNNVVDNFEEMKVKMEQALAVERESRESLQESVKELIAQNKDLTEKYEVMFAKVDDMEESVQSAHSLGRSLKEIMEDLETKLKGAENINNTEFLGEIANVNKDLRKLEKWSKSKFNAVDTRLRLCEADLNREHFRDKVHIQ